MADIALITGPELLRFRSFQDWVNHARSRFARSGFSGRPSMYIAIDASGRICTLGKHFTSARDRDAFPVVVYHVDPDYKEQADG